MPLGPLYTRGEGPWEKKFQPMECVEIEKTKEGHFTSEIFSPRDKTRRKWHGWHFCPLWQQKNTFFKTPGFATIKWGSDTEFKCKEFLDGCEGGGRGGGSYPTYTCLDKHYGFTGHFLCCPHSFGPKMRPFQLLFWYFEDVFIIICLNMTTLMTCNVKFQGLIHA